MAQTGLPRVLAAGARDAIELVQRLLETEARVVPAHSVEAAVQRLDEGIALIVASVGLDDSRIFDFLGALQEGAYRRVPVICFRMASAGLPPAMEKSVELALREIGIAAFVDLDALERERGTAAALAELRSRVLSALSAGAYNPPPQRLINKEGP